MTLLRDTRGLATVEAAVVLPIFIGIFAGLVMLHRMYSTKLETMVQVRECAWAYANGGCKKLPAGCMVEPVPGSGLSALLDSSGQADQFGDSIDQLERRGAGSATDLAMGTTKTVGDLLSGLMGIDTGFRAVATRQYRRPSVYGGGLEPMSSNYALLCNEKQMKAFDIVVEIYCAIGGQCEQVPKQ